MTVADLIEALQACDPRAVVLIPVAAAASQATEPVVDVTPVKSGQFNGGAAARGGAVRLTGFPLMLMVSGLGAADLCD